MKAYLVCKTAVPELLGEAADQLVQVLGGRGYIETNIAPRLFRDARSTRIFEGPTEPLLMHPGGRVVQHPRSIPRVLDALFGAADVADELLGVSRDLVGAEARWGYYQLGLLATDAVLFAAARRSPDPDAAAWGQRRYHLRRDALRSAPARGRIDGDALLGRVRDFARAIGDVTETLPGEDHTIDPLLAATAPAARAPAEPPGPPDPTPGDPVRDVVLAWLRSGPDPAATGVPEHTPFTSLGMGSLEMVTLTRQLAAVVGASLAPETLSLYPTLADLRSYLVRRTNAGRR